MAGFISFLERNASQNKTFSKESLLPSKRRTLKYNLFYPTHHHQAIGQGRENGKKTETRETGLKGRKKSAKSNKNIDGKETIRKYDTISFYLVSSRKI